MGGGQVGDASDESDIWCGGRTNIHMERPTPCVKVLKDPSLMCDGDSDCFDGSDEHDEWCNPARRHRRQSSGASANGGENNLSNNGGDEDEDKAMATMSPRIQCLSCHPDRVLAGGRYGTILPAIIQYKRVRVTPDKVPRRIPSTRGGGGQYNHKPGYRMCI